MEAPMSMKIFRARQLASEEVGTGNWQLHLFNYKYLAVSNIEKMTQRSEEKHFIGT